MGGVHVSNVLPKRQQHNEGGARPGALLQDVRIQAGEDMIALYVALFLLSPQYVWERHMIRTFHVTLDQLRQGEAVNRRLGAMQPWETSEECKQ